MLYKNMSIPKNIARKVGRFYGVSPSELECVPEYAEWLEAILHEPCSVWRNEDGELILLEIRQLVNRVNGLKIEIYPNEHAPPHFHVKSPNVNASFTIDSCKLLNGTISSKDKDKIEYWHLHSKPLLIEVWNDTRPTNCTVGEYNGT